MKLLLDTHVLLWVAVGSRRLSNEAKAILEDSGNTPFFSVASLWEIAIKHALRRGDFGVDPSRLRVGLLNNGYVEIAITGEHAVSVGTLPALHKDPFDRMLLAQARAESMVLLTADRKLAKYGGPVRLV